MPEGQPSCQAVEELLEAYLDEAIGTGERARLRQHLEACPACAAQHELARRIRTELRALPARSCPPRVSRKVFARTSDAESPVHRLLARLGLAGGGSRHRQPALAGALAAALVALVTALWLAPSDRAPAPLPESRSAEVAQAEEDVKLALAYLGLIGERAGTTAGVDVLERRVVAPMTRSIAGALVGPDPDKGNDHAL